MDFNGCTIRRMAGRGEVTELLYALREGDPDAFDRLVPLVYQDLRRIARGHLRRGRRGETLDTTGLVHEAYVKMVHQTGIGFEDRSHFLAVAAVAMRQIIISNARRHMAAKRGGGATPVTLDERRIAVEQQADQLVAIDDALERLAAFDPRLGQVVECRFFAGLSEEETAEAMGVSLRTAQRDWMRARAWLKEELSS